MKLKIRVAVRIVQTAAALIVQTVRIVHHQHQHHVQIVNREFHTLKIKPGEKIKSALG